MNDRKGHGLYRKLCNRIRVRAIDAKVDEWVVGRERLRSERRASTPSLPLVHSFNACWSLRPGLCRCIAIRPAGRSPASTRPVEDVALRWSRHARLLALPAPRSEPRHLRSYFTTRKLARFTLPCFSARRLENDLGWLFAPAPSPPENDDGTCEA